MDNFEDSTIDNILLSTRMDKKKLIKKGKSPLESNPELEDWIDDLKIDLYKGAPGDFNKDTGSSNPPFRTQTVHSSSEGAPSPIIPPIRDEIHFF